MSEEQQVVEGIKKLNLQKGDILVLDARAFAWLKCLGEQAVAGLVAYVGFEFPVIVGDVQKMNREDLVKLLENMPS